LRRVDRLDDLTEGAARRVIRLRMLVSTAGVPVSSDLDRALSYVVIESANLWAQFCRAFYISTALRARDAGGHRIVLPPGTPPADVNDALTLAIHRIRPRLRGKNGPWSHRDEPTWHDVSEFLKVMARLKPSNLGTIRAAVSYEPKTLSVLPTARNFYAHKGEATAVKARGIAARYGLSTRSSPSSLLCSRAPGRPQPLILDWLDDLRETIKLSS
jgi:hypothetical protein